MKKAPAFYVVVAVVFPLLLLFAVYHWWTWPNGGAEAYRGRLYEDFVGPPALGITAYGDRLAQLGQLGDSFGSFNAIVGVVTVLLLLATGFLQWISLREARATFARQQFEDHFFKLLDLVKTAEDKVTGKFKIPMSIDEKIKYGGSVIEEVRHRKYERITGRDALTKYAATVMWEARQSAGSKPLPTVLQSDEGKRLWRLVHSYRENAYDRSTATFGPYMRMLFHLFSFVQRAQEVDETDRERFTKLAIATLNESAVFLLALNGLTVRGRAKFKPLIESLGILEHLPPSAKKSTGRALRLAYRESAFKHGGSGSAAQGAAPELHDFIFDQEDDEFAAEVRVLAASAAGRVEQEPTEKTENLSG